MLLTCVKLSQQDHLLHPPALRIQAHEAIDKSDLRQGLAVHSFNEYDYVYDLRLHVKFLLYNLYVIDFLIILIPVTAEPCSSSTSTKDANTRVNRARNIA